jgi:hypothetical protein
MGVVETAFGVDSLNAILFSRSLPFRHHQASVFARWAGRWGGWQITRGHAQRRNQQATTRPCGVGAAGGGGPDDGAVGTLLVAPVPKRFEQVVTPTQAPARKIR